MLKVRCPRCAKDQLTQPRAIEGKTTKDKVKRCVFCGHSFKIILKWRGMQRDRIRELIE